MPESSGRDASVDRRRLHPASDPAAVRNWHLRTRPCSISIGSRFGKPALARAAKHRRPKDRSHRRHDDKCRRHTANRRTRQRNAISDAYEKNRQSYTVSYPPFETLPLTHGGNGLLTEGGPCLHAMSEAAETADRSAKRNRTVHGLLIDRRSETLPLTCGSAKPLRKTENGVDGKNRIGYGNTQTARRSCRKEMRRTRRRGYSRRSGFFIRYSASRTGIRQPENRHRTYPDCPTEKTM